MAAAGWPQVSTTVLQVLVAHRGSEITADTRFREGELIRAVPDIEDRLEVAIPDGELRRVNTVGDLLSLCERRVAERKMAP